MAVNLQQDTFIQQIEIKKLLHLENIIIPLAETHKKHLILTGKNGSGKTKTLEAIRDYLDLRSDTRSASGLFNQENQINDFYNKRDVIEQTLLCKVYPTNINNNNYIDSHNLIFCYFSAYRGGAKMIEPIGVERISTPLNPRIVDKINSLFLKYLVDLEVQRKFSEKDENKLTKYNKWFENFNQIIQRLFEDESLRIDYDFSMYTHYIVSGAKRFKLSELSSGYAAVMDVISEIIFRMQTTKFGAYDVPGIVLIDEVDVHLHVELQKNILPFLTTFFPNIQFIVTTHSPFVLQSIANAVIYDLENKIIVEDLSAYSWNGIVENYFNIDQYSSIIKQKMQRYEDLKKKQNGLQQNEILELLGLESSLISVGDRLSPELATQVKLLIMQYGAVNV